MNWSIFTHGQMGTFHCLKGLPYQDTVGIYQSDSILTAFLLDGCSRSPFAQVGAQLAASYLARRAHQLTTLDLKPKILAKHLFNSLLLYLHRLIVIQGFSTRDEEDRFITDYLLFTVSGLIITPKISFGLICGDGLLLLNDFITYEDHDDRPPYPGYCLQSNMPKDHPKVPKEFHVWETETESLSLIGLVSDAFTKRQDLLEEAKTVTTQAQLELKINQWTEVYELLGDDATVLLVKKTQEDP